MRKPNTNQRWTCVPIPELPAEDSFIAWLDGQTGYTYALAHANDGVIWGRFADGQWSWSSGIAPSSPPLRAQTLQQLRLFGANGELLLWRSTAGFAGCTIQDGIGETVDWYDEDQLLWGEPEGQATNGFQLMREGAQGLLHAPPKAIAERGRLKTRNYIGYDKDGRAFVKASRLVVEEE